MIALHATPGIASGDRRGVVVRRRVARLLRPIEISLVVAGLALLAIYGAARLHGSVASTQAIKQFERAEVAAHVLRASPEAARLGLEASAVLRVAEPPDQTLWGQSRMAAYRTSLSANLGAPLGTLTIPKIDLRVPVFDGTADVTLNRGVGRIEGTASIGYFGNLGIAGHRDGFFRGLKDVVVGDAIDVRSLTATVRYRITEILIVAPTDVYVLDPTEHATLTLVTCYPFYFVGSAPQRYIVKATAEDSSHLL